MPFTEQDNETMGRIADATLAGDITKLTEMLADKDLIAGLMVSGNRKSDPIFEDKLELLISHLEFVIEVARDRAHKA